MWFSAAFRLQSSLSWWSSVAYSVPEVRSQRVQGGEKLVEIGRSMGTPVVAKRGMVPQIGALGSLDWRW